MLLETRVGLRGSAMSADFVMLGFQSQLDTGAAKKFQTCFLPLI